MSTDKFGNLCCNRCWNHVTESYAILTPCCHLMCSNCARDWFATHEECSVCSKPLNREADLLTIQLESTTAHEQTMLGLSPTKLLEVIAPAIGFWEYQKKMEIAYQHHLADQREKSGVSNDRKLQAELAEAQNQLKLNSLKIAALEQDLARETQAFQALDHDFREMTRMRWKYEELYHHVVRGNKTPMLTNLPSDGMVLGAGGGSTPVHTPALQMRPASANAALVSSGPARLSPRFTPEPERIHAYDSQAMIPVGMRRAYPAGPEVSGGSGQAGLDFGPNGNGGNGYIKTTLGSSGGGAQGALALPTSSRFNSALGGSSVGAMAPISSAMSSSSTSSSLGATSSRAPHRPMTEPTNAGFQTPGGKPSLFQRPLNDQQQRPLLFQHTGQPTGGPSQQHHHQQPAASTAASTPRARVGLFQSRR